MAFNKKIKLSETKPVPKKETSSSNIKLKKGETISFLIETAKKLVEEKLSKCITNLDDLKAFFDNTPEDSPISIDTETTGLNFFTDKIVGFSEYNGKDCLYIPIN